MRRPQITTAIRTHEQVAAILGLSRGRVQKLEARAIEKLRLLLAGGSSEGGADFAAENELFRGFAVGLEIGVCEPEIGNLCD